jgi:endoglycosylceramidase
VAVLAALAAAAPAAAAPTEPLRNVRGWVADAHGRVVILRGVNVVPGNASATPESVGFGADDAALLRELGMNVVRLGFFGRGWEPEPGRFDGAYMDSYTRTQRVLAEHGVFTLLDLHQDQLGARYAGRDFGDWFLIDDGLPNDRRPYALGYVTNPALNRAYDNLWANRRARDGVGLQDHLAEGWRRVAARFAALDHIAGYDIFNEPWPGQLWPLCASPIGCLPGGFDQTRLTAFSNRMARAIRPADPRRIVWYEPNLQFDLGAATGHGKLADPNAGFSFHNYCLAAAPGLPQLPFDPLGLCQNLGERLVFENARRHRERTGAALLLTEFGDTDDPAIVGRVADAADLYRVGFTAWAYIGSPAQYVRDPARPPAGDNLRAAPLAALVRPYPRVVAGTPEWWRYDRARRRFGLGYRTTLPDGRSAGVLTSELYVPRLHFPAGYRLAVTGARVVAGLGTQVVTLQNLPGAARVAVTVTPR